MGTVCFGIAASQAALLLAGGEKGMRYAMPNARIMIHQPQGGCGVRTESLAYILIFCSFEDGICIWAGCFTVFAQGFLRSLYNFFGIF